MLERLDRHLAGGAGDMLALAVLDLEGFGEVKDSVGEAGGEEVALEIADRLRAVVPADVMLAGCAAGDLCC